MQFLCGRSMLPACRKDAFAAIGSRIAILVATEGSINMCNSNIAWIATEMLLELDLYVGV